MSAVAIFGNGALAQTISDFERKFEIKELQLAPGETTSVVSVRCPAGKAPTLGSGPKCRKNLIPGEGTLGSGPPRSSVYESTR